MNTKKRLNCYVFSNLIVSFLTLNILNNNPTTELIKKTSTNMLNKIYEKGIVETITTPDTFISNEPVSNVISISNKVVQSGNNISYVKPSYNSVTGTNLVNYASQFVGLRYVSAGNSLSTGTDCSGFTKLIYQEFGITLGRTVSSQIYSGTYVSKNDLQPGDLVFYSYGSIASHVAIYMGNGLIIHESNPRDGVKISTVNIMNYITARRLITSNVNVVEEVKTESIQETVVQTPKEVVVESKEEIVNTQIEEEVKEQIKEEVTINTDDNLTTDTSEEKKNSTLEIVETKETVDDTNTSNKEEIIENNNELNKIENKN